MASIADQSIPQLGGRLSVLARQRADHIELDRLLHRLEQEPHDRQRAVLLDLYRLVFPHAFAEESVLWPVMRRLLEDGDELTLQVEMEHQEVNEIVTRLERAEPGPERDADLARLAEVLREDVRDEEDELFPRLQARLSPARLRALGVAWEVVRRVAPTRAHPIVARRPPGNVISALPLSVLDRSRDRIDARRLKGGGDGRLLLAVSDALTRSAHLVERAPGMRRGEHAATSVPTASPARRPVVVALGALVVVGLGVVVARRR